MDFASLTEAVNQNAEITGFMMLVGFAGSIFINVALGAFVSAFKALTHLAGGG